MADDFNWMVGMHRVAAQFGDGLKPELAELLKQRQFDGDNVADLPVRQKSVGPKHQFATPDQLDAADIPTLRTARAPLSSRTAHTKQA